MPVTVDPRVALTWIERVRGDGQRERARDEVAVEEPLEIRVDGAPLAVTMRTPGEDEELAVGFLAGEALIAGPRDIAGVGPTAELEANVIEVRTANGLTRDPSKERRFHLSSSCGVCGKAALEHVHRDAPPSEPGPAIEPELVFRLPAAARLEQPGFERTGGLHATGLFEPAGEESREGRLLALREDVGRHNAMDKALGALLLAGRWPLPGVDRLPVGQGGVRARAEGQPGRAGRGGGRGRPHEPGGAPGHGAGHVAVRLYARELVQRLRGCRSAGRNLDPPRFVPAHSGDQIGDGGLLPPLPPARRTRSEWLVAAADRTPARTAG